MLLILEAMKMENEIMAPPRTAPSSRSSVQTGRRREHGRSSGRLRSGSEPARRLAMLDVFIKYLRDRHSDAGSRAMTCGS
ncbi:MAG: hypothetical protein MZU95_09095 [Desulfomicrobium escambiense]|nr:hypothetical protein [Desulfomicrobium escambiense]